MKVIAHVDLDAFYTQVEIARDPDRLAGQPVCVIQYNPFGDLSTLRPAEDRIRPESNGSIIAVSYEARKHGVKRNMMAQQAKKLCPNLQIVQVPVAHGKADLTIYRDAGAAVINILSKHAVCEHASIDEAYMDVTAAAQQLLADGKKGRASSSSTSSSSGAGDGLDPQAPAAAAATTAAAAEAAVEAAETAHPDTSSLPADEELQELADDLGVVLHVLPCPDSFEGWHVAGLDPEGQGAVREWWCRPSVSWAQSDSLLAAGALVVARARAAVKASLGFTCSAGIAHSKILAKLGSGLHKPAQQTLVPAAAVSGLLAPLPLPRLRQLGGKFGEALMAKLDVSTVGELAAVPLPRLEASVGVQDAAWLHRLAQGQDGEEVKPRMLPKSISCGKTFRGQNVLTGLTAVHHWLLELAQELQERVEADRQQHERLPKLLTVSFDSAPLDGEAGPSAAVAAAAAGTQQDNAASSGRGGPQQGRLNAQNWRAGVTNISRSCALRHARADAIANDALGLIKKWARDRPSGFRIVTMFVSVSNFSLAPTGASTLERFFKTPAAVAAVKEPAAAVPVAGLASTGPGSSDGHPQQQKPQHQRLEGQQRGPSVRTDDAQPKAESAAAAPLATWHSSDSVQQSSGLKRPAAGRAAGARHQKAARTDRSQSDLRTLLVAASSAGKAHPPAPAPAPAPAAGAAAAAAATTTAACADVAELLPVHEPRENSMLRAGGSVASQLSQGLSDADTGAGSRMHGTACIAPAGLAATAGPTAAQPVHTVTSAAFRPALPALSALRPLGAAAAAAALPDATGSRQAPQSHQPPSTADVLAASAAAGLAHQQHDWHTSGLQGPHHHQHQEEQHQEGQQEQEQRQGQLAAHSHQAKQHSTGPIGPDAGPGMPAGMQQGPPAPGLGVPHADVSGPAAAFSATCSAAPAVDHQHKPRDGHRQWPQEQQGAAARAPWVPAAMQLADIDPEVMAALPWDVQMEVQQQLRANRTAEASGRAGAGIRGRRGRAGSATGRGDAAARSRIQHVPAAASIHRFLKK